jgi:hypothetical protein
MTELENLTAQIKLATDYQVNKTILKEKIQTDLHFAYNGGLFKATQDLIAFVYAWNGTEAFWPWDHSDPIFLEDTYGNPIRIDNRQEFYQRACEQYQQAMNTWHQQHEELKRIRRV